jgi:hypothetical protein
VLGRPLERDMPETAASYRRWARAAQAVPADRASDQPSSDASPEPPSKRSLHAALAQFYTE